MRLYFVRHGESEANLAGRMQGWFDSALTPRGAAQAACTATALRALLAETGTHLAAVYSSPLRRAARTAALLAPVTGCSVTFEPGLREMHFGDMEGILDVDWQAAHPDLLARWRRPDDLSFGWPGGETRQAFYARIAATLARLTAAHPPDAALLVVTHGGIISSYVSYLQTGAWQYWGRYVVGNCSITEIHQDPGGAALVHRFNATAHLQALAPAPA